MYKNSFLKLILPALAVVLFVSCDKDFNEIGADIIGDDHFDFTLDTKEIVANTVGTGPVQSNNLPVNPLGIYTTTAFGKTRANFVTQVELASANPTIGTDITDVKVSLTVPYFSNVTASNADGTKTYELDSIYGGANAKINLSVYRSGYFLGDIGYEGEEQVTQRYYSNQNNDINNAKVGPRLNNGETSENTEFTFSNAELTAPADDADGEPTTVRTAPGMRLKLDSDYFKQNVLEAGSANLLSNNAFRNYFRGLYFNVQEVAESTGSLAMLNFKLGKVTITYKAKIATTNASTGEVTYPILDRTIVLNMTGNTVSLLEQVPTAESADYYTALNAPASAEGQSRIYLKGGEGSVATIDLFDATDLIGTETEGSITIATNEPNGIPDAVDQMRIDGWLINEASLTMYVDKGKMAGASEPDRLYLYNISSKGPTLDYIFDNTTDAHPKYNKGILGGILEKGADERGIKYKIRVTNYVRSLIRNDSTYVRLGLAVTEDIATTSMAKLRSVTAFNESLNEFVPTGSVISPLGTVLYGNNIPVGTDYDKRMRLEIYYTKPN